MRFDEATKQFLAYGDLERAFSPLTISAYESFRQESLTSEQPRIDDVTRSEVRGFIVQEPERGLSSTTVARRINCLRSFWHFLEHAEITEESPLDGIRLPKEKTNLPTFLTDDEMRRLLDAAGDVTTQTLPRETGRSLAPSSSLASDEQSFYGFNCVT